MIKISKDSKMVTIEAGVRRGHWEVNYEDGLCGNGFYDKSLDEVVRIIARVDRKISSIEFVED